MLSSIGDWNVTKTKMKKRIVLVNNKEGSPWETAVIAALAPMATLTIWTEKKTLDNFFRAKMDLLLIDASTIENEIVPLVQTLHLENEWVPIVVATTSPTWRRARAVLLAGATDYIGRSFEYETIRAKCLDAMDQTDAPIAVWE